jgi:transcription elongation factor GreA
MISCDRRDYKEGFRLAKEYKMSQERLDELKQELNYLKTVREKEVADQIKEARSFGDLSENSEYDEAKNEQGKLYSRIVELSNILSHAIVIDEDDLTTDAVGIGSRVTVEAMDGGGKGSYQIVGSQEADPMNGRISEESPFGQALLGKKCGEEVLVSAPAGTIHYRVIEIQK